MRLVPGEAVPASSIKNYGGAKKLGASSKEGRLQDMVTKALFRKGVRNYKVEIGISFEGRTAQRRYYAIVSFTNGNKAPPEKVAELDRSFLEYGVPNVNVSDEFIALCVLLQP